MSAERVTYLDSSALVKLAVGEAESGVLRRYVSGHRPIVSSGLVRTEVARALMHLGDEAVRRGHAVVAGVDLIRVNDRVLEAAGALEPPELRSLDAIHIATALQLGASLGRIVTYDERMAVAAARVCAVVAPA